MSDINAEQLSGDFLIRRSDDLFYGYYHDTNGKNLVDAADKFSQYFVVYDEKRVNDNISDKLTATYRKKKALYMVQIHILKNLPHGSANWGM